MVAQSSQTNFFPVTVDGRPIFKLKNFKDKTAQTRGKRVNEILQEVIQSEKTAKVKIEKEGKSPIIRVNGKYLLTVTQDDANPNSPKEQSEIWRDKLTKAIERAREERTTEFIRSRILYSIAIIIFAVIGHRFLGHLLQLLRARITPLLDIGSDSSDEQQHQMFNLLSKGILFLLQTILWVGITLYIANLFPLTSQWSFDIISNIIIALSSPIVGASTFGRNVIIGERKSSYIVGLKKYIRRKWMLPLSFPQDKTIILLLTYYC
ncbi:MAG: hypothetical protein ACFB02_11230 [Mastigocoleus sp.]